MMPGSSPSLAELTPGISAAGSLDRDDIEALAQQGVRTIVNNRPDGEDPGQLSAAEAQQIAEAHGIAYHHIPFTMPTLSQAEVEAFAAVLAGQPEPLVAHCRSGTRSALLWALVRLREGEDPAALVAAAARGGIDISPLPAIAARLR
jgi:sulfide:quinone oxidoreductase